MLLCCLIVSTVVNEKNKISSLFLMVCVQNLFSLIFYICSSQCPDIFQECTINMGLFSSVVRHSSGNMFFSSADTF